MKTVFVGGGHGCRAVLELVLQHKLASLSLDILAVVDRDPEAPGMAFARERGWTTLTSLDDALALPDLELVIELTGIDAVRDEIYHHAPVGVRVMDHTMARVFWDLDEVAQHLRDELAVKTRLEGEIREDRRCLQEILDSLPDVVMVVDEVGRIERVNRRFEKVTGLKLADVNGMTCLETCCRTPDAQGAKLQADCPRMEVLRTGEPVTSVRRQSCIGWCDDGEERYLEITANPIRTRAGARSVVITSREVTEQILLKRETEVAARRFDQILATVRGMITIKDLEMRYVLANPSASRFFGIAAPEFVGKTATELFSPAIAGVFSANDEAVLADQKHRSDEEVVVIDGQERILISERVVLRNHRDEVMALCCVSRDVTEPRRLQRELLQSEKHAAVGKLAAGVAHEINNPLTGILTFAEEMLEEFEPGSEPHDDLSFIVRETLRCRQIVRDLLDFSRHYKPNRQSVPAEMVVRRAMNLVSKQASFQNVQIELKLDAPDLQVEADPNQLQQVMLNLIINARDAVEGKGKIELRVAEGEGARVVLEVRDDGCGIPRQDMTRIFEPFYSTKGVQGNGLGLAAVRSIVEEHGGRIVVTSEVGVGTTFRVSLPARGDGPRSSTPPRTSRLPSKRASQGGTPA